MNYYVLESFHAKTKEGEVELEKGQLITLPKEKALTLITQGKIIPAERVAYKIYSEILGCFLWVVYGPDEIETLRDQGITEPIYTATDIAELRTVSKENVRAVHQTKQIFPLSLIEEITREGERK